MLTSFVSPLENMFLLFGSAAVKRHVNFLKLFNQLLWNVDIIILWLIYLCINRWWIKEAGICIETDLHVFKIVLFVSYIFSSQEELSGKLLG